LRSVLHLQPHPGEGAETYIDVLEGLEGWEQHRAPVSRTRRPAPAAIDIVRRFPRLAVMARRADVVHAHGEVAAIASLPILAATHSVWTTHGLHLVRRSSGPRLRLAETALRAIVAATDRTICVSEPERAELVERLGARAAAKLVTIENGLPPVPEPAPGERAAARAELGLDDGTLAVLFAARLEERKDPIAAARAVSVARAEGAQVTLVVAGEGPLAGELAGMGDDGVRLLGQREDVGRLLAAADAFVLPSHREGLSYALLEAMAHGVPPIASDVPGNADAVGDAGLLVPVGDVAALARAFGELASDAAERERLGRLAAARADERFGAERMIAATRAVYEQVLAR